MLSIKDMKSEKLEKALSEQLQETVGIPEINEDELFVLADYDENAAEKGGYSNYSYWSSTLRVFFKNRTAVFLLIVLALLLMFTIIQPYLPGQYPANLVINNPQTDKQFSNQSPSLTTVRTTVPAGTTLKMHEGYFATDDVIISLPRRSVITVIEYGEEWCKVIYTEKSTGMQYTGYVMNNEYTKLTLADDPTAVPYEGKVGLKTSLYSKPVDLWYAVDNVLTTFSSTVTSHKDFTVLEYGEDWLKVAFKDRSLGEVTGYIKNDFQTKLEKTPVDMEAFPCAIYAKADLSLYAERDTDSEELAVIPAETEFIVNEYAEDWCHVSFVNEAGEEKTGYIKNGSKAKLANVPTDPTAVPYETFSYSKLTLYSDPIDYSNGGNALYAKVNDFTRNEDGTVTAKKDASLCIIPTSHSFWFGTNNIGQDLWARVWSGTRTSLFIGFAVAIVEAIVGILVGVLWGYVRQLDRLLTEVYNVVDNIPNTIILILISYILRPSMQTLIFAMCLTGWLGMARFIRNQIVIIRDRDYNLASRCLGTSTWRIIMKNLLPYLVSVITLRMALSIPGAIGSEVFITYIGLGLPGDTPSLGNLINEGRLLITSPTLMYQLIFPTIVLSIVTISFYIIGNAFADAADPKNHV